MISLGYSVVIWEDGRASSQERHTIGTTTRMNLYIAELAAIKEAVDWARAILMTIPTLPGATIYSDYMSALQAIAKPARQSGQSIIKHVTQALCEKGGQRI